MTHDDTRLQQLTTWLRHELHFEFTRIEPASYDASFRRYFRLWRADGATRVLMDAPPDKESTAPFLKVARLLARCGVHVPSIDAADPVRGFVLLEDLGTSPYLARLRAANQVDELYGAALEALQGIQLRGVEAARELSAYDHGALIGEMALMPEWFCTRHLQLELPQDERALLDESFEYLARALLTQPRVFVHRDYHSRNLMWLPAANPGIIDFQDAVAGPIGYDLVSLLKDCYIDWPRERVEGWVGQYRARLASLGGPAGDGAQQFLDWFDVAGLQRHIKVLGIFARLWLRDGKSGYLADLPRTLQYVRATLPRYPALSALALWLERRVVPAFQPANARALARAGAS